MKKIDPNKPQHLTLEYEIENATSVELRLLLYQEDFTLIVKGTLLPDKKVDFLIPTLKDLGILTDSIDAEIEVIDSVGGVKYLSSYWRQSLPIQKSISAKFDIIEDETGSEIPIEIKNEVPEVKQEKTYENKIIKSNGKFLKVKKELERSNGHVKVECTDREGKNVKVTLKEKEDFTT